MFRHLFFCLMAIVVIGGCSDTSNLITPNQIDTILSTCDTDIDIDIANGNYTGTFDINKACVDNVLLTTNPVDDTSDPTIIGKGSLIQNVSVDQLVNDTKNNGTTYQGKLVFVTAEVERNSDNETLYLTTNDTQIDLRIWASGDVTERQFKEQYIEGQTYDFVLYVKYQEHPDLTDEFTFNDNRWSILFYLVENGNNIQNITIQRLVDDTKQGNKSYEGKIVSLTAIVDFSNSFLGQSFSFITLNVNASDIAFYIGAPGWFGEEEFQKTYQSGNSYDFILYIREQEFDEEDNDWNIWSSIVE